MSEQYNAITASQAAAYLGETPQALPPSPVSSTPPPPEQQPMWPEDQVLALLQEERDEREQLAQAYETERQRLGQELTRWRQYSEQLQAEQQLSHRQSGELPASSPQVTRALHHELEEALGRLQEAEQRSQLAEQRLRLLQEQVASEPPPSVSVAPASPFGAPAAQMPVAAAPVLDDLPPDGTGRKGVPALAVVLIVAALVGGGAGAYFGAIQPQLARERLTAQQSAELMHTETKRLRDQLEAQRTQSEQQVADLNRQLQEAKTQVSAAAAPGAPADAAKAQQSGAPKAAQAQRARRAKARRRAQAKRRARTKARRRAQARRRRARAKSQNRANDPIAGLD